MLFKIVLYHSQLLALLQLALAQFYHYEPRKIILDEGDLLPLAYVHCLHKCQVSIVPQCAACSCNARRVSAFRLWAPHCVLGSTSLPA